VQYDVQLGNRGRLRLQTDFSYRSKVFFDAANSPLLSQRGHGLLNARAAWTPPGDRWELAIWGQNRSNEKYLTFGFDRAELGLQQRSLVPPRSFGIELRLSH